MNARPLSSNQYVSLAFHIKPVANLFLRQAACHRPAAKKGVTANAAIKKVVSFLPRNLSSPLPPSMLSLPDAPKILSSPVPPSTSRELVSMIPVVIFLSKKSKLSYLAALILK